MTVLGLPKLILSEQICKAKDERQIGNLKAWLPIIILTASMVAQIAYQLLQQKQHKIDTTPLCPPGEN